MFRTFLILTKTHVKEFLNAYETVLIKTDAWSKQDHH